MKLTVMRVVMLGLVALGAIADAAFQTWNWLHVGWPIATFVWMIIAFSAQDIAEEWRKRALDTLNQLEKFTEEVRQIQERRRLAVFRRGQP